MSDQLSPPIGLPKVNQSFRCYAEYEELSHRLDFADVSAKSRIKFIKVLFKLKQIDGFEDIGFINHSFKYFGQKDNYSWIRSKRFYIQNGSKIIVIKKVMPEFGPPKPATVETIKKSAEESFEMYLCLVESVKEVLDSDLDSKTSINWQLVSSLMRSNGYGLYSQTEMIRFLRAILNQYLKYLSRVVFQRIPSKGRPKDCANERKRKLFAALDSMCLRQFVGQRSLRSLNRLRDMFAVKQTVNYLMNQTVATSDYINKTTTNCNNHLSLDFGLHLSSSQLTAPAISTSKESINKGCASNGSDATIKSQKYCKRQPKGHNISERFNHSLVTIIHDLQTLPTDIDWTVVTKTMQSLRFRDGLDPQLLAKQFEALITRYINTMKKCDDIWDAIKHFPHFLCIHYMDLSPFCSRRTHQLIQRLRDKYHTKYDCISVDSQPNAQHYYPDYYQNY